MIDVWILVFYVAAGHGGGGGPAVIDNIVSKESCLILVHQIPKPMYTTVKSECIKVQKVKVQ